MTDTAALDALATAADIRGSETTEETVGDHTAVAGSLMFGRLLCALRRFGPSDVKDCVLARRMALHDVTDWDFFDNWRPRRWTQHKAIVPDRSIIELAHDALSGAQGGRALAWTTCLDQRVERKISQLLRATGERFDAVCGMQSESSFVKTLSDFTRHNGVTRMLRSDNAQVAVVRREPSAALVPCVGHDRLITSSLHVLDGPSFHTSFLMRRLS